MGQMKYFRFNYAFVNRTHNGIPNCGIRVGGFAGVSWRRLLCLFAPLKFRPTRPKGVCLKARPWLSAWPQIRFAVYASPKIQGHLIRVSEAPGRPQGVAEN